MANTVYDNKVIEAISKDLLTTAVNTRSLMKIDNSLVENAGMTKNVNVYTYNGTAAVVTPGQGSSARGSISYEAEPHTVQMIQQAFDYFDEDFMKDPTIVDNMLKGANQVMVNKMTTDFVTQLASTSTKQTISGELTYDAIVDAISKLNVEDESKLVVMIPNAWKAALRKDPDYVSAHMGDVVYNGQVGVICGLPVVASKALTDKAYVFATDAVTLFMKKDVEVEQSRDADKRKNSVYLRTAYVVALTDKTKACEINKGLAE